MPGGMDASASRWWLVDGRLRQRMIRDDYVTGTTLNSRELLDVNERLRHMDSRGVDVHVIYPTFFLSYVTGNPEAEVALTDSYSRYVSRKCAEAEGAAALGGRAPAAGRRPGRELPALGEGERRGGRVQAGPRARQARERSVLLPRLRGGERAGPAHLHPHRQRQPPPRPGSATATASAACPSWMRSTHSCSTACRTSFPSSDSGSSRRDPPGSPYVIDRLKAERKRRSWIRTFDIHSDLFRRNRFFVAVDAVEDISYILRFGTEDSLMMGSDYTHFDTSAEPDAIDAVRRWATEGQITETVARKILEDNPQAFYGI